MPKISAETLVTVAIGMAFLLGGCGTTSNVPSTRQGLSATPGVAAQQSPTPEPTARSTSTPIFNYEPKAGTLWLAGTGTPMNLLDPNHWQRITSPDEVVAADIQHISQSQDGTMWFAGAMIFRYDGKNWSVYDQEKIPAFHGHVILSLAVAPDGTVWVGTEKNEIVSFDGLTWMSQTVEEGGYRDNEIVSLVARKNGEVCAISIEAMSCLRAGKWAHYPFIIKKENINDRVYVWDAALTPSDEIWVPFSNGVLYHYDGRNWESRKISYELAGISANQDGSLWIVDEGGPEKPFALGRLDIHGNIVYKTLPPNIESDVITAMQGVRDGTVWFGSAGSGYELAHYIRDGVALTADGKVLGKDYIKSFPPGYPFYHVYCIFQVKDGSMWFGTLGGIFRYK